MPGSDRVAVLASGTLPKGSPLSSLLSSILLLRTAFAGPEPVDAPTLRAAGLPSTAEGIWAVLPPDSGSAEVVVLHEGTEAARLDTARWRAARDSAQAAAPSPWRWPRSDGWDDWRRWTRAPAGLLVQGKWGTSLSPGSSALRRESWSGRLDLPWRDWVSVGLSAGTERVWTALPLDRVSPTHDGNWWGWWGVGGCVRSLCAESRTSRHPLPEALRNQSGIDSLVGAGQDGDLARRWSAPGRTFASNWEQTVSLRAGVLSWRGVRDPEVWTGWSHEVALSPLPGGPVRWGLLAGRDRSAAWTGIVLGPAPWRRPLPRSFALSLLPPELTFRWTDARRLSLEIRSVLELLPSEASP